jgi:DegV family protein with EDD domain
MRGDVVSFETLDAARLADAFRAGAYRLFSRQEHLDKINVFPVPDGDTGTNLSMTMHAVLNTISRDPTKHAGRLLTLMADAAIDGARGNSGAILAQFLLGLGDSAESLETLSVKDFAAAMNSGADYARSALTEPREGTFLTVAREFGAALVRLAAEGSVKDFRTLFTRGIDSARESLEGTRGQLDALRAADVVDAGAQGLVELLEGMLYYFETGTVGEEVEPHRGATEAMAFGEMDTSHRFCTECVISGDGIDQRRLRETLNGHGSSLVVAGTHRKVRIHIHSNDPEDVFRVAANYGKVSAQKADDMLKQQAATHHAANRTVAVVTDSAADIPDEALERLELHVVPLRVIFGSRSYLDKVSISPEEFYRELANNPQHPKTSQPPPGDFRRVYEFLLSHYQSVVSISIASKVSGSFNVARTTALRMPENRVNVIDTSNASLGQGLIAMYAAECALAGYSSEAVLKATNDAVLRTKTYGLLDRLDFAVRGGRVPKAVARLAELLNFSPVIASQTGGRIGRGGVIFGKRDLHKRFAAFVKKRMKRGARYRIAVGHANAEAEGRQLLDYMIEGLDQVESTYLMPLGAALGTHGGPGMLVVGVQEYVPPVAAASR